jgi:hypothetical protein
MGTFPEQNESALDEMIGWHPGGINEAGVFPSE